MDLLTGSLILNETNLKESIEKNNLKLKEIFTLVSISSWATILPPYSSVQVKLVISEQQRQPPLLGRKLIKSSIS